MPASFFHCLPIAHPSFSQKNGICPDIYCASHYYCPLQALTLHDRTQNVSRQLENVSSHKQTHLECENGQPGGKKAGSTFCIAFN